jgi:hypothetical protein
MKSSFHRLIPFLPLFSITFYTADCLSCLLQLPTLDLTSILAPWDPRYIASGSTNRKTASSIVACWFTAAERCLPHSCIATSATRTHRERRLQHLFYCCVTSQRTWRVPLLRVYGPLPSNGCFSASTVLALRKYATVCNVYNTCI